MAKKSKNKPSGTKKAKKGFILSIGDEGAILSHFDKGTLVNRVFVDSPFSPDIKLMKKLFELYPRLPITIYVDIIEQNYVHANLPPLSASAVKKQAAKKLTRDFQPNDLTNFVPLGREKEGRKDWKYLFISLANTEPFSNWIELVMEQKNKFNGVYVLAIESCALVMDLNTKIQDLPDFKWELVVMHNKISGFRIIAFNNKKIYFTRLTQHIIGENIAEVVAGNLEQEIVNTIEYLKRLGYSGEQDTHVSIIANADILKKLELSRMKFGRVDRYTPFSAAEKLGLQYAVKENDKYADILASAHFANSDKRFLKFNSKLTLQIINLQIGLLATSVLGVIAMLALLGLVASLAMDRPAVLEENSKADNTLKESELALQKIKDKKANLPADIGRMVEVLDLDRKMPEKRDLLVSSIYKSIQDLPTNSTRIKKIEIVFNEYKSNDTTPKDAYSEQFGDGTEYINPFAVRPTEEPKEAKPLGTIVIEHSFDGRISLDLNVKRSEMDILNEISATLLNKLKVNDNKMEFSWEQEPKADEKEGNEDVTNFEEVRLKEVVGIPAVIKFHGSFSEEKKPD